MQPIKGYDGKSTVLNGYPEFPKRVIKENDCFLFLEPVLRVFLRRAAVLSPAKGMLPHGCALDSTTAQRAGEKKTALHEIS